MNDSVHAKKVLIFRNGDPYFAGLKVLLSPSKQRNFPQLLIQCSNVLHLNNGVQRLYTMEGVRVKGMQEMVDLGSYVATNGDGFKPIMYARGYKHEFNAYSKSDLNHEGPKDDPILERRKITRSNGGLLSEIKRDCSEEDALFQPDSKAFRISAFNNGDRRSEGTKLILNYRNCKSFDQLLRYFSMLKIIPTGSVRKVYDAKNGYRIRKLAELYDGIHLVLSAYDIFQRVQYRMVDLLRVHVPKEDEDRKLVRFYPNGDAYHTGLNVSLTNRRFPTLGRLIDSLNTHMRLVTGLIQKIYTMRGARILLMSNFMAGGQYVVVANDDAFLKTRYNMMALQPNLVKGLNGFTLTNEHLRLIRPITQGNLVKHDKQFEENSVMGGSRSSKYKEFILKRRESTPGRSPPRDGYSSQYRESTASTRTRMKAPLRPYSGSTRPRTPYDFPSHDVKSQYSQMDRDRSHYDPNTFDDSEDQNTNPARRRVYIDEGSDKIIQNKQSKGKSVKYEDRPMKRTPSDEQRNNSQKERLSDGSNVGRGELLYQRANVGYAGKAQSGKSFRLEHGQDGRSSQAQSSKLNQGVRSQQGQDDRESQANQHQSNILNSSTGKATKTYREGARGQSAKTNQSPNQEKIKSNPEKALQGNAEGMMRDSTSQTEIPNIIEGKRSPGKVRVKVALPAKAQTIEPSKKQDFNTRRAKAERSTESIKENSYTMALSGQEKRNQSPRLSYGEGRSDNVVGRYASQTGIQKVRDETSLTILNDAPKMLQLETSMNRRLVDSPYPQHTQKTKSASRADLKRAQEYGSSRLTSGFSTVASLSSIPKGIRRVNSKSRNDEDLERQRDRDLSKEELDLQRAQEARKVAVMEPEGPSDSRSRLQIDTRTKEEISVRSATYELPQKDYSYNPSARSPSIEDVQPRDSTRYREEKDEPKKDSHTPIAIQNDERGFISPVPSPISSPVASPRVLSRATSKKNLRTRTSNYELIRHVSKKEILMRALSGTILLIVDNREIKEELPKSATEREEEMPLKKMVSSTAVRGYQVSTDGSQRLSQSKIPKSISRVGSDNSVETPLTQSSQKLV